jgi:hypothetical protein
MAPLLVHFHTSFPLPSRSCAFVAAAGWHPLAGVALQPRSVVLVVDDVLV